jgi:aryl-alcohol dehydrogenase-like predicted oxidoreductase
VRSIELGRSGLQVSRVVFGAMATRDNGPEQQKANLQAALDAGVTAIDTAPLYDFGLSERLVGEAIAERRAAVVVLTKVGLRWDDDHGEVLFSGRGSDGVLRTVRRDSRPAAVRRDVEESLVRLGVEALDLVQVHHPDRHTPIAETMGELLRLRDEGKLRAIGVSNYSASEVHAAQRALGDVPLASHQLQYSLLQRWPEQEPLPIARETRHGVLAYSPLARGVLGGRTPERAERRLRDAIELQRAMASRLGVSSAQLALAWLLAQDGLSAVIAGASTPQQARDAAEAARLELSAPDLDALGSAFAGCRIPGAPDPSIARRAVRKARRVAGRVRRLLG